MTQQGHLLKPPPLSPSPPPNSRSLVLFFPEVPMMNVGFNDNYDSNDGILMKKITEKDTNIMTFE